MNKTLIVMVVCLSRLSGQVPCERFEDGYRDVRWQSTANRTDRFFQKKTFKREVFEDFQTNDNRQGLVVLYSRGSYSDFRSDRDHEEVNLIILVDHPISITYIFHFNWTYHINTAKEIATDIATQYKLPMTANQVDRYGNINLAWVGSCDGKRIIVRFVWTEIIGGETTRYVAFEVMKIKENEEFEQLRIIANREEEERSKKNIKKKFQ